MKKHGAGYSRPHPFDPWAHNRVVAKRKKLRGIARQFRDASRTPGLRGLATAFREMGVAADHAANSLRGLARSTA